MPNGEPRTIQSAEVVFDIFDLLREWDSATLTELADALERAPSTVHQYLATLERYEFVVKEGNTYYLSHRFLDFGVYVRQRNPLFDFARQKVRHIAEETGERAQFSVTEHGRVVVLYTEAGEQAVRAGVRAGQRLPMHATAAGKAILAFSTRDFVEEVVARHGLRSITENTITDIDALTSELATIRDNGIAYNDREDTRGLRAVGTPILDTDGHPLGALSLSGPGNRLEEPQRDREIQNLLRGSANELELRIEYE